MKKQLLLGSALLAAITAFPQSKSAKPKPSGTINMMEIASRKYSMEPAQTTSVAKPATETAPNVSNPVPQTDQSASEAAMPPSSISWKLISGSNNVYGQILSNSKPLQYNPELKAISYIHRKSQTYVATPAIAAGGQPGVMVADISSDLGVTWDSTCFWADGLNGGRYPQGAIYSAFGNTNIANAYVVGSGPVVTNSAFTGSWYSSKKLGVPGSTVFNSTADMAVGAQTFVPYSAYNDGWPRQGFVSVNDGFVRTLSMIQGNPVGSGNAKMRGVTVVKGTFAAGVFNWSHTDSIIPSTYTLSAIQGTNSGAKVLDANTAQMVFNQAGTHGYIVMLGAASSQTNLANKGYQPIIYKTTNGGTSWTSLPPMDFSLPSMSVVTNPLISSQAAGVSNSVSAPFFKEFDIAVDANNKLHLGALVVGEYYSHTDSLAYSALFTADKYSWPHQPGLRPYVYDFIGDGTAAWDVRTIDSLWTEDPGGDPSQQGFTANPWDATGTGGAKMNIESRLQLGRTPDGNYITFSWAESDTNFITGAKKWNVIPDIKARCMSAVNGTYSLATNEINVSKVAAGQGTNNIQVASKAYFHYMSPIQGGQTTYTAATTTTVDIYTPFTVTNSAPTLAQLTNNRNWYAGAKLSWNFGTVIIGIKDNNLKSAVNSVIYPNPAKNNAMLALDLKENTPVNVTVFNLVGQVLKATTVQGQLGENNINIDLSNLTAGIYMVNVKVGGAVSTKKLIVE